MSEDLSAVGGQRAARDIAGQLLLRGLNVALGLAVVVLLVRALGDEDFGRWATVLAIVSMIGFFGDLGLEQVAVNRAAAQPDREREVIAGLVSLRLALGSVAALLAAGIVLLISDGRDMRLAGLVLSLTVLTSSLEAIRVIFSLRVRNTRLASVELVNGLLWAAAVAVLAAVGAGLVGFAAAFVGVSLATTALLLVLARRLAPFSLRGGRAHWRELVVMGLPVALSTILILSYSRIDQVLVFEILGERDAGLYGVAYRVLERIVIVPETIAATLFPLFAAAWAAGDRARIARLVQAGLDLSLLLALPALAFCIVAGEPLLELLFGSEFGEASATLAVLMGVFVLVCAGPLVGFLVIVVGFQGTFLRYAATGLVVNVVGNVLLLPSMGIVAAAWVTLATEIVVIGGTALKLAPHVGVRVSPARWLRTAGAAAGMAAVVALAHDQGASAAVLVLVAAAVYVPLLLAVRGFAADDVRMLRAG